MPDEVNAQINGGIIVYKCTLNNACFEGKIHESLNWYAAGLSIQ
jgi:hypothetical protein